MNLAKVLNARSVAIIGASKDERKRGFQAIRTLLEDHYEGEIYPVNPKEESILGLRCYKNIQEIEARVDLALITTPAETVPGILKDCGKKGIGGVVIIAGGFGEFGEYGKALQQQIVETAAEHKLRIIGPNTSGVVNMVNHLNLAGLPDVPKGDIALVSQSGNVALHMITEAKLKSQRGFSYYVGVGNEADVRFDEYLEFFTRDPNTKAILMYVEGLRDGRKFLQEAYKTTTKKPVVLLKGGRSAKGKQSIGSHTGALAGLSEVARTAFGRAGIITVERSDELFPVAETLSSLPPIRNGKVAILADGGGHATIAADKLTDLGVEIPRLHKNSQNKLRSLLPANAPVGNPVDVAGGTDADPGVFADCARALLEDSYVGGLLIAGLFGGYAIRFAEKLRFIEEDAAHQLGKLVVQTGKPIVLHSLYNHAKPHSLELLRYYNIPVFDSLDIACKCLSSLSEYGHYLSTFPKRTNFVFNWRAKAKPEACEIIRRAEAEGRRALMEHEAKRLLGLHGAPVTSDRLAAEPEEAVRIARDIGEPVALKIVSPDILHKTDACGVRLRLSTEEEVRSAFCEIIESAKSYDGRADIKGCLVSPMACDGVEVIVGTKIDEQFGPVVMFGLGGILVEVVKDVSFRVLPISKSAAAKMITEIKSAPILNGVRGRAPVDKNAIVHLLHTVSEVIEAYPEILEMDLNPVIATESGITIVDARIILKSPVAV